jgi:hypothetical protein
MNRAMLGPMVLPGATTAPSPGDFRLPALIAAVAGLAAAGPALAAGADLVQFLAPGETLGQDDQRDQAEFLARHPDALVLASPAGQLTATGGPLVGQALTTLAPADLAAHPPGGYPTHGESEGHPETGRPQPGHPQDPPAVGAWGRLVVVDADLAAGGTGPDLMPLPPGTPPPGHDLPPLTPDLAAIVATAALASWLGAAAVRTRHVAQVRRALDQTAIIRGLRPPARTVRGLA